MRLRGNHNLNPAPLFRLLLRTLRIYKHLDYMPSPEVLPEISES